jgi:hypothetical protein
VFDVNSLYPYIMHERLIPYGEPEYVAGRVEPTERRPLTIQSITFTATLKPDHVPTIQIKGTSIFSPTEYLTEVAEPTTIMVSNVDLALMRDHYDLDVLAWEGGWRFTAARGMFNAYIDKWMRVKEHSTGGMRFLAKLQLNNLWGKFTTNPNVTGRVPMLGEKNTVELKMGPHEERNPVYTAAGVFITSYARDLTIRAAQANYARFAYADTDSLHLVGAGDPTGLDIHKSRLGAWKQELEIDRAYYIRAKAYLEYGRDPGDPDEPLAYHNAVAGLPKYMSAVLTFEDLRPGLEIVVTDRGKTVIRNEIAPENGTIIRGKLTPKTVPGGVVLTEVPYELKLR